MRRQRPASSRHRPDPHSAVKTGCVVVNADLTAKRDKAEAQRYLERGINRHGLPEKVIIDKSAANTAAIHSDNIDAYLDIELRGSVSLSKFSKISPLSVAS